MTTMETTAAGFLPDVGPDHAAAILVPLVLPVVIWLFLRVIRLAARADVGIAHRFVREYEDSPPLTRVAAFLLVLAGAIHLSLVPEHLGRGTILALLFAANGVAFLLVGIAAFVRDRWRPWAASLLVATIAAYLFYLGTGREAADLVGTTTYVVELIALGVIWIAHDAAPTRAVPVMVTVGRLRSRRQTVADAQDGTGLLRLSSPPPRR